MPPSKTTYTLPSVLKEDGIESGFIGTIQGLKFQVNRVQHMVKCIVDDNGNGFVWDTTCSGKTLTSIKASPPHGGKRSIHKCVFVVDRKDLDSQPQEDWNSSYKTSSEGEARRGSACSANQFNRFQEGCVEENTNTAALVRRLLSEEYADKVIVTTM